MTTSTRAGTVYLLLGLIAGLAIGWFARGVNDSTKLPVRSDREQAVSSNSPVSRDSELAMDANAPTSEPRETPRSSPNGTHTGKPEPLTENGPVESLAAPTATNSPERSPIPVSDAHATLIGRQFTTDKDTGERRAVREILEEETYDDSWSFFMEQALRQFISSHADSSQFSIFHIECRTTMCEIQAIGFDESTASNWSRVLYDLSLEPWYEFSQVGTFQDAVQGQLAILTRLSRKS